MRKPKKGKCKGSGRAWKEDKTTIVGSWRRRGGPFQRQRKYFQQIREKNNPKSKKSITYQSVRLWEKQIDKTRNLTHVTYKSKHEMCRAKKDIESLVLLKPWPLLPFGLVVLYLCRLVGVCESVMQVFIVVRCLLLPQAYHIQKTEVPSTHLHLPAFKSV